MERAAKLNADNGSGSLTALPIIETQGNDVSAFIPTNVISITDGQIFLGNRFILPRHKTSFECWIIRIACRFFSTDKSDETSSWTYKGELAQYREMAAFAQFGSDLDASTQALLARGERLTELLKQPQFSPLQVEEQVAVIYAGTRGYLDTIPVKSVQRYESNLLAFLKSEQKSLLSDIASQKKLTDDIEDRLKSALDAFAKQFEA